MDFLVRVFTALAHGIARAGRYWMDDISKRKSLAGKVASLGIGLLVLCCGCSFVFGAVRSTGQAVGLVATNTPTALPTATPRPTATPEATEVPPTKTPAPTRTPEPTETPAPTEPPRPTDTPEPTEAPRAGLGITRRAAEAQYRNMGLAFTKSKLLDGRDRSLGSTDNSLINAEFIGPDPNLVKITVFTAPTSDPEQNMHATAAMLTLLNLGVPKWGGAGDWMAKNMEGLVSSVQAGETSAERKTTVRGREVSLSVVDLAGTKLIFLSVEMAP